MEGISFNFSPHLSKRQSRFRNLFRRIGKPPSLSSSSSSILPPTSSILPSSSSADAPPGKFVCICVCTVDKYEWYLFDVSDDIRHNQPPPPAKYINYSVPFHEDDESGVVNLKPKATANTNWIVGWAILGLTLYILDDWSGDWKGPSVSKESNRVDRIDLGNPRAKWESLPRMPNQIAVLAHTLVLAGKFYCLGGFRSQTEELEGQSQLAMAYDLSLKAGDSLPSPPCLDLEKIFSTAKEVPKPKPSLNMELERPLQLSTTHDQLESLWDDSLSLGPSQNMELERPSLLPMTHDDSLVGSTWLEISSAGEELNNPCLPSQNMELEWQIPLAMNYDPMLNVHPPGVTLDKTLSSAKEVTKPGLQSQNMESERQSPWAMVYDPRQNKWESLPDPQCRPIKGENIFSSAGEFPHPCIVVGSPEDGFLQIYNVNDKRWERREFKICPKFGPNVLAGPALAVDSKLYWYSVDHLCLVGYDLVTMMWSAGNLPIHDHGERFGVRDVDTPPRLAHLGGNKFCLLWVSVLPRRRMKISESKDDCISRLHCMKLQVTPGNNFHSGGNNSLSGSVNIPLEVSILSCQSYLASGLKCFRGGLVVDGHSRYFDV